MSLAKQPEVISLDPQLLGDIIENVRLLGRATGAEERADEIAEDMESRIEAVTARAADADSRPSVLHVEWADPLMCGGPLGARDGGPGRRRQLLRRQGHRHVQAGVGGCCRAAARRDRHDALRL